MKFDKLTTDQLLRLSDTSKTTKEIASDLNIGEATVGRWRKKLGIVVSRGSKKNKPRPWQSKTDDRVCLSCGSGFTVKSSSSKRYCSLSCSTKSIYRSYMQTEEYRNTLRKGTTPEYRRYSRRVHTLTAKVYDEFVHEINPQDYPRGLAGVPGMYHLDHIVSIRYGFDNNIPPEQIAVKENLQMLPWAENISKGK